MTDKILNKRKQCGNKKYANGQWMYVYMYLYMYMYVYVCI